MSGGNVFRGLQFPAGARWRAFTLIELLVVVSIVSLLMAILLTPLGRVRRLARATACLSNVRQWGLILYAYAGDHEGKVLGDYSPPWWSATRNHYDTNDILLCPEAVRMGPSAYVERSPFEAWAIWWTPERVTTGSYGINSWLYELAGVRKRFPGWLTNIAFQDFAARHWDGRPPRKPARTPLLGDCVGSSATPQDTDNPPLVHGDFVLQSLQRDGWGRNIDQMKVVCLNRHGSGRTNMTFMDGSSRHVGLKELWTLQWHYGCDTTGPWTKAGGVQPSDWPAWMRKFKDY